MYPSVLPVASKRARFSDGDFVDAEIIASNAGCQEAISVTWGVTWCNQLTPLLKSNLFYINSNVNSWSPVCEMEERKTEPLKYCTSR